MAGEVKNYVEIPEQDIPDLGVDFDKILTDLNVLRDEVEKEVGSFHKTLEPFVQETGGGSGRESWAEALKFFLKSKSRERDPDKDKKEIYEDAVESARDILGNVASRVDGEVDSQHEVALFEEVKTLVGIVSVDKGHLSDEREVKFDARYHADTDKVEMRKKVFEAANNLFQIIVNLAESGGDYSLGALQHELIHKKQNQVRKSEKSSWRKKVFSDAAAVKISGIYATSEAVQYLLELDECLPDNLKTINAILALSYLLSYFASRSKDVLDLKKANKRGDWRHQSILDESQAYLLAGRKRNYKDGLHVSFSGRPDGVFGGYGDRIEEKGDWDRLAMAYQQIKQLHALGISEEEITKLVVNAKWDDESTSYTEFDEKINEEAKRRGLEMEDVDNLVLAEDLKTQIKMLEVSLIAMEEFNNFIKQG